MKRDFTNESLQELLSVIEQIRNTQWSELTDWFGDRYFDVKHWLGKLGVYDRLQDMERYHREVLDRENVTAAQLKAIYEDVSSVDSMFARSEGASFGYVADTLRVYRDYLNLLTEQVVVAVDHAQRGGKIGDLGDLQKNMRKIKKELKDKLELIEFTAHTFDKLSDIYKNLIIEQFETANPEYLKLFAAVLSDPDMRDFERRDIKFLAYSAPEPYRSIYLEHLKEYQVQVGGVTGSYYKSGYGIFLTDGDGTFLRNPRGPYNTFFHESGHAIDDFEQGSGSLSHSFEYEGKTLHDWIVEDVRNYVEELIRKQFPELNDAQVEALLRSLNLSDDASFDYQGSTAELDGVLKRYRDKLVGLMEQDLAGEVNEAASDVYGGVTNNALIGDWGHRPKQGTNPDDYSYWYRSNGKASGMQESELWAEFFAAQMTQDQEALESIKAHFPNAYKALEAMAAEMASN